MIDSTVRQLAATVGIPVERLLEQLQEAGMRIQDPDQVISIGQQWQLLKHLQHDQLLTKQPTTSIRPITLKRKSVSELKLKNSTGKGITISVEIRKKRTYLNTQEKPSVDKLAQQLPTKTTVITEQDKPAGIPPAQPDSPSLEETIAITAPGVITTPQGPNTVAATASDTVSEKVAIEKKSPPERNKKSKSHAVKSRKRPWEQVSLPEEAAQSTRLTKRKIFKSKAQKEQVESFLQQQFEKPTTLIAREISIPTSIKVADLAQKLSIKAAELIKTLMKLGVLATINQVIDQDIAAIAVEEMGHIAKPMQANILEENLIHSTEQQMGEPLPRPPIVTIMGHVDHGKTSLLDHIRRTKVTLGEAGGITQHIGAYHVEVPKGMITFLDTPGHSAFTAMRARGAQITDIVVLVVAADDGVMPQTIEAIDHAKAANVPIVVAINKIDKKGADLDNIQNALAKHSLIPEAWGGDTMFIPVSARTGAGIDDLLDAILTQAEMLELKAATYGPAQGTVIESRLEKGRGAVATVLVQRGMLHKGDILLAGSAFGRVRALLDEQRQPVLQAGPAIPVEVLGLSTLATVGDEAVVVKNERKAREIALFRESKILGAKLMPQQLVKVETMLSNLGEDGYKTLNIILKADSQGSVEALQEALNKLSTQEVKIKLLVAGVGAITESDVHLAMASQALLLGFNVRGDTAAKRIVTQTGLVMHCHSIIYNLLDQVKNMMSGLLTPEIKETVVGIAEVREVFRSSKLGTVAGCLVTEGIIRRSNPVRVLRDNVVIYTGELHSLRHFKDDVNEVRQGAECGIRVKNYTDIQVNDTIEMYESVTTMRTL